MLKINMIYKANNYTNHNVIDNTLNYIFRLESPYNFFYGIWPPTTKDAIAQYKTTRQHRIEQTTKKQVQHFILSFPSTVPIPILLAYADEVANLFARHYQTCFSFHDDTDNYHCHYIVSTTSYMRHTPPLTDKRFESYIVYINAAGQRYSITLGEVIRKNV